MSDAICNCPCCRDGVPAPHEYHLERRPMPEPPLQQQRVEPGVTVEFLLERIEQYRATGDGMLMADIKEGLRRVFAAPQFQQEGVTGAGKTWREVPFPDLPRPVVSHPALGPLFDRMAMHQYALRYGDLCREAGYITEPVQHQCLDEALLRQALSALESAAQHDASECPDAIHALRERLAQVQQQYREGADR